MLNTKAADDVLQARAEVAVAQERYYAALDRLSALQTDDQSPSVTAAQGAVDQAQTAYDQSQKAVAQAQANLDLLDAQLAKLTVYAPMEGVILTRSVEPGEYVQPGAAALTMGDISELTITVYVPEDRYGQIHLGQTASVKVDSFPATDVHGAGDAHCGPGGVHAAQRADGGRAQLDGVCHQADGDRSAGQAQTRHAGGRDVQSRSEHGT